MDNEVLHQPGDCPECRGTGRISALNCASCNATGHIIVHSHPHAHDGRHHDHPHSHAGPHHPADGTPHDHKH